MFVEGAVLLYDGQTGVENFTSSGTANTWLANKSTFPNGIFRVEYFSIKVLIGKELQEIYLLLI